MSVIFSDHTEKFFVAVLDLLDLKNTSDKNVSVCNAFSWDSVSRSK